MSHLPTRPTGTQSRAVSDESSPAAHPVRELAHLRPTKTLKRSVRRECYLSLRVAQVAQFLCPEEPTRIIPECVESALSPGDRSSSPVVDCFARCLTAHLPSRSQGVEEGREIARAWSTLSVRTPALAGGQSLPRLFVLNGRDLMALEVHPNRESENIGDSWLRRRLATNAGLGSDLLEPLLPRFGRTQFRGTVVVTPRGPGCGVHVLTGAQEHRLGECRACLVFADARANGAQDHACPVP